MTSSLFIILVSATVLVSYAFLRLARQIRVPAIVLLLLLGMMARIVTHTRGDTIGVPAGLLNTLGTIGLVFIVFEATLDLDLRAQSKEFLLRTFAAAALGLIATTALIAWSLQAWFGIGWLTAAMSAAPFGVISSAVAIPGAAVLPQRHRDFVVYESSWSDILGVMLFNALLLAGSGSAIVPTVFGGGVVVLLLGVLTSLFMYWLVGHVEEHVKFIPMLFALLLVYSAANALNLSPLLIVLVLGTFLNNPQLLDRVQALQWLRTERYQAELVRLKHVAAEAAFLVRTFFFALLGYATPVGTFTDRLGWQIALAIVVEVVCVRALVLWLARATYIRPLLWMAPRGLITATLFLNVPSRSLPATFPPAALILVILLSCAVMTVGVNLDSDAAD